MGTGKGRRRPVDWHPLAEKDPVPGDPADIRDEVGRMKNLASTLRDQARILRKAADGEALKGKYADKIRDKSGDLEKHFRETAARYERVVGDLGHWANELEDFQERADGVLRAAKRADEEHTAEVKKKEAEAKKDGKDGKDGGKKSLEESDPNSHLAPYHKQLNQIVSERDSRAQHYADNIGDDISDIIKDSTWENFKDGVHEHADTIKSVIEVLSWAATAIGIIALLFTPVGWLATLITVTAISLTALVGIGHTLLALSGDGNWADVAMDVFALATLGFGSVAMKGVKAATTALKSASRAERFQRYANLRKLLNKNLSRYGPDSVRGSKAERALRSLRQIGARETRPVVTRVERLLGGDGEVISASKFAKAMRAEFGGNPEVVRAADALRKAALKFKLNYGAATVVDVGDKLGEKGPYSDQYGPAKDVLTREAGSRW
ncbi:putative T7SS-secreted protein [Streptomyces sp. NPDC047461]|uniref:putative T7SS-secreted protein n=1 Tax=Streptomyces sp. NPDC047461 TaxID=3155619 RepID=UPI0033CEDBAB